MEQRRRLSYKWLCRAAAIWDFIDRKQVVRRLSAVWIMILSTTVAWWTMDFAWTSTRPGLEVAAIIAAIWTPLSALQGFIFKFYDEVRHVSATTMVDRQSSTDSDRASITDSTTIRSQ